MFEQQPLTLQEKVKLLATEAIKNADPSSWFDTLYDQAKGDINQVPWAKNQPHPYLQNWLETTKPETKEKTALVIGCGLGDDAEILAKFGYQVIAFDISPTAINWCKQRFPDSLVSYQVADLFALNPLWKNSFDLVYESRNIQAIPIDVRSPIINTIGSLVADKGTLLIITRWRDNSTIPDGPPWAISEEELSPFQQMGLEEIQRLFFVEGEIQHLRIEYR